jgi:spore coat protein CotH
MGKWWCLATGLVLSVVVVGGGAAQEKGKKQSAQGVFGLDKVHGFHLEFTAKEWDKMQQVKGGKGFGFGGPPKKDDKPADPLADLHKGGGFGMEFPWATASFTAEGKAYKNVGVRYKGNFTYMASQGMLRRPMQIDLEHQGQEQRFHDLKKLNFGNGVADPSRIREALAFGVFRAAGVPAPRTAFAEITLTVPGKYDKELIGMYTMIEFVGRAFLKDHFKNADGLLVKPEGLRSLDYLGEDWKPYEDRYRPKTDATKEQKQRLIDFTRIINKGDDEQFRKEIASYLDIDEFLRYLAVNALIVNPDSFLGMGHNYFMYLRPDNDKFVIIPWDLDLSMGSMPFGGSPEQQIDLSLQHPHMGQVKLIDRLLAMKDVNAKYQKILKEVATTAFGKEKILKDIATLEQTTKESLAREKKAQEARKEQPGGGFGGFKGPMGGQPASLKTFVEKRTESVVAQLAGERKGYEPPGMGFGPPGGKGGKGFGLGQFLGGPLLKEMDTNDDKKISQEEMRAWVKKIFKEQDRDGKGMDDKAFGEVLVKFMPKFGPPKGPPDGKGPPDKKGPPDGKGPPGGFDFGLILGGMVVKAIDPKAESGAKITLEKALTAFDGFFKDWDKNKDGSLDEAELAEGLNRILVPPGFGPPPGGDPFPKKEEKK